MIGSEGGFAQIAVFAKPGEQLCLDTWPFASQLLFEAMKQRLTICLQGEPIRKIGGPLSWSHYEQ
ncbi:hypothetical protein PH5382_03914 [Phaeobacter sp. CECT 5382]|nr:hypothetical protein PH5382_03914 [Phaeobacter sp. CECT 5382]